MADIKTTGVHRTAEQQILTALGAIFCLCTTSSRNVLINFSWFAYTCPRFSVQGNDKAGNHIGIGFLRPSPDLFSYNEVYD